jgi:signal transduction histidine kinase
MHLQRQHFPWQATILLVFAVAPMIAGAISFSSSLNLIGKPSIGVLPIWQDAIRCHAVSPITPPSWPAMADGSLQTGDCIETINGISAYHWPLSEVERYADAKDGRNLVDVEVRRGAERFSVRIAALRLTWLHVLQLQFGILPIALFVWMLALIVLLAQPRAEVNQTSVALFLTLALAIVGLYHGLNNEQGRYYTAFTIVISMAWIGPFLYHLALLTPRPLARCAPLRFALHPVGLTAMILHLDSMLAFVPLLRPWRGDAPGIATTINGITMLIGLGAFLMRAGWWVWRGDRAIADQMRVLLLSWGIGAGPLTLASAYYLLTYRAPLGTSFQPFLFFLVILCSGIAYVMLRYQHFAGRSRVLDSLAMIYISATVACAVMVVVLIGIIRMPVDGLMFTALWFATFATTVFWHTDNPFQRLYRRFFLRHHHHYQATLDFATRMNEVSNLEDAAKHGAALVRTAVMCDWAAVHPALTPDRVWLATGSGVEVRRVSAAREVSFSLPASPAMTRALISEGEQLGTLYVGSRSTQEPFDEEDERLIGLLATMLANAMHIRAQIQRLLAVPALMIAAQEQERERIAQEIHDGVMPFLGAIPLGLAQIQRRVEAGDSIDETISVCETYRQRAIKTAQELRAIMRRLQPPLVGATRLGLAIQAFTEEICALYNVPCIINGAGVAYPLHDTTARQAYRIVQQAVVNALQHAHPRLLRVTIAADEHGWECEVSDDGRGFDPDQPQRKNHFGLFSMHERARTISAVLTIDSQPGRGTTVRLRLKKALKIEDETWDVSRYPVSVENVEG